MYIKYCYISYILIYAIPLTKDRCCQWYKGGLKYERRLFVSQIFTITHFIPTRVSAFNNRTNCRNIYYRTVFWSCCSYASTLGCCRRGRFRIFHRRWRQWQHDCSWWTTTTNKEWRHNYSLKYDKLSFYGGTTALKTWEKITSTNNKTDMYVGRYFRY